MKTIGIIASLVFVICAEAEDRVKKVDSLDIREQNLIVVGRLGLPLGTPVVVEAEVVSGSAMQANYFKGHYLLKVDVVADRKVEPIIILFRVQPWSNAKVASNDEQLLQRVGRWGPHHGAVDGDFDVVKRKYVGTRHKLVVYEAACFDGVPKDLPQDCAPWSDLPFQLKHELVVMAER